MFFNRYGYSAAGMAHITGGGLVENPPRILPQKCAMEINLGSWDIPSIFHEIQSRGPVEEREMLRTFNMGIGMIAVTPEEIPGYQPIGRIIPGNQEVTFVRR